jgi:hypothetical protein
MDQRSPTPLLHGFLTSCSPRMPPAARRAPLLVDCGVLAIAFTWATSQTSTKCRTGRAVLSRFAGAADQNLEAES